MNSYIPLPMYRASNRREPMTQANLDVVGIGDAIVDVIAHADEAFLEREGLVKGTMTLIDAPRAEALYRIMGPAVEVSGGSVGNTMAGPCFARRHRRLYRQGVRRLPRPSLPP